MNAVKMTKNLTDCYLISRFYRVPLSQTTIDEYVIEFDLNPNIQPLSYRPASILGLIVDSVTPLIGQEVLGDCMLVEFESSILNVHFTDQLKVVATIESIYMHHAVFNCQIYGINHGIETPLAVLHGTLKSSKTV